MAVVIGGAALYFRQARMLEQEHELASFLIKTAAQQATTACRELAEIEFKRKYLKIAREVGETGFVSVYNKQIQDKEKNVGDVISGYKATLLKLVDLRKTVVDEEFREHTKLMVKKGLFNKVRTIRLVKNDYQKMIHGERTATVAAMRQVCTD